MTKLFMAFENRDYFNKKSYLLVDKNHTFVIAVIPEKK